MHTEVANMIDSYNKLHSMLETNRQLHAESIRKIQIAGIIFVTVIFFLLLLKQFGLFKPLWETLVAPEYWIWNTITGKKDTSRKSTSVEVSKK